MPLDPPSRLSLSEHFPRADDDDVVGGPDAREMPFLGVE